MKVERLRPTVLRITMHVYEVAALMSAARWIAGGAQGEVPEELRGQLGEIVDRYDSGLQRQEDGAGWDDSPHPSPG